MPDVVRMGVVGAGSIAVRGILPHLSQPDVQDRVRLQAVCDPAPGRAEAPRSGSGSRRPSPATGPAGAGRGGCGEHRLPHRPALRARAAALEAGKHVHFNKTMTTTVDEASELIETAAARASSWWPRRGRCCARTTSGSRSCWPRGALGRLAWAAYGRRSGRTTRKRRCARGRTPSATSTLPGTTASRGRPAVRHDGLRPARADRHPGPGGG